MYNWTLRRHRLNWRESAGSYREMEKYESTYVNLNSRENAHNIIQHRLQTDCICSAAALFKEICIFLGFVSRVFFFLDRSYWQAFNVELWIELIHESSTIFAVHISMNFYPHFWFYVELNVCAMRIILNPKFKCIQMNNSLSNIYFFPFYFLSSYEFQFEFNEELIDVDNINHT